MNKLDLQSTNSTTSSTTPPSTATLLNVINEEEQHKRTVEDIKEATRDLERGPNTSTVITLDIAPQRALFVA